MKTKRYLASLLCLLTVFSLAACGAKPAEPVEEVFLKDSFVDIEEGLDLVPLAETAPVSTVLMPVASGKTVYSNTNASIDASNLDQGYVMIKYTGTSTAKKKVLVTGPSGIQYTYNLKSDGAYETFPLSDGNGAYKIGIYQNTEGTKYSTVYTASISVTLKDEFAPYLLPNQYVNYKADSKVVTKAQELVKDKTATVDKISVIYNYVVTTLTYDTEKAKTVQSGYLPDVDAILDSKKGICFDYAAVMAAMLRSQGVATKLVVGYTGTAYHAWINAYSPETGWINNVIFFDGTTWKLMDPTFASGGKSSESIMKYIGDGTNYQAKYLY